MTQEKFAYYPVVSCIPPSESKKGSDDTASHVSGLATRHENGATFKQSHCSNSERTLNSAITNVDIKPLPFLSGQHNADLYI